MGLRVLHVAASLSSTWGGPVAVVANLTSALKEKGVQCTVVAPTGIRVGTNPVEIEGVRSRVFPTSPIARYWAGHSWRLSRELQSEAADHDLIHIHELWHHPHYVAYRAASRVGVPYMVTIHGELDPWALQHKGLKKQVYMRLIQRRMLGQAVQLHAITDEEERQIRSNGLTVPVTVIPNGVHPEEFQRLPSAGKLTSKYPALQDKKVVLFLGRIHEKKGFDILAEALGIVSNTRDDVRLLIAGPDDGYLKNVKELLETYGVLDKTIFAGMLDGEEKLMALRAADIFVLPSYSEGFSISVLEAMASALPVIVSRHCNFPEIAEAKAGIVIDTDAVQLSTALNDMLDHPEERRDMGERGRQLVADKYSWSVIAQRMANLYERVCQQPSVTESS